MMRVQLSLHVGPTGIRTCAARPVVRAQPSKYIRLYSRFPLTNLFLFLHQTNHYSTQPPHHCTSIHQSKIKSHKVFAKTVICTQQVKVRLHYRAKSMLDEFARRVFDKLTCTEESGNIGLFARQVCSTTLLDSVNAP
jgi:hypothetical protein